MSLLAWKVIVDGEGYLCAARSQPEALGAALIFEAQQPDRGEGMHWPAFSVVLYEPRRELQTETGTLQVSALLAQAVEPCVLAYGIDGAIWSET